MLKITWAAKLCVLVAFVFAIAYAVPNLVPSSVRASLPAPIQKTVNLGLDLQGGAHLVLAVQIDDVTKRAYENLADEVRGRLRGERLNYLNLRESLSGVSFNAPKPEQLDEISKNLRSLTGVSIDRNGSSFTLQFTEQEQTQLEERAMAQTLEIMRSRVDEFGVSEPVIQRQGRDRIIVELPGIDDVSRAKSIIGRTAQLTFHIVDRNLSPQDPLPPTKMVLYEELTNTAGFAPQRIGYVVNKRPNITGEMLAGASTGFDQMTGEAAVYVKFDNRGTRQFGRLTTQEVGKQLAIVLDGEVYSAPRLNEPILGGTAQITGGFSAQEAEDLATVLRAGALPAKVAIVEERTVGPSLGQDSVNAGRMAIMVGFLGVLIVMLIFYQTWGVAANIALLFNLTLMLAVMTAVGFTLTLPGMAGILLTIGMAVDANVLIFERIREEAKAGRKPRAALDAGFKSAFGTILDANVTTLIAAVVLFAMGSGPVKGFALTLTVGILTSLFTAIMVTRLLLVGWLNWRKPRVLKV